MAFSDLLVSEIFLSLQGESTLTGVPFTFVRLTGCNLRCGYCDTAYAFKGGKRLRISEVVTQAQQFGVPNVLLTGGEPLMQRHTLGLVHALRDAGFELSIETHGEVSIAPYAGLTRIIMDIKTPSSGMSRGGFRANLPHLQNSDEIKFVIGNAQDYQWSKALLESGELPLVPILFSPVQAAVDAPRNAPELSARWLAEKILEDRLAVRFQIQLHKYLWGANQRGV